MSLVDRSVNVNLATKPRMISIKNLAKNGPVGVLKPCCTIAAVPTRALTHTGSSLLHPAANPLGSLTPAEAPLINAEILFRQPGPAQSNTLSCRTDALLSDGGHPLRWGWVEPRLNSLQNSFVLPA